MLRGAVSAAALVLTFATANEATAGKLDSVRSEVSGDSSSSSSSGWSISWDNDDDDDDDDSSSSSDSASVSSRPNAVYHRFPFAGGAAGVLRVDSDDGALTEEPGRRFSGRVWGEGAWQGDGLWRSGGGFRLDGQHFGIDGDLSFYYEPAARDALYLGTTSLNVIPLRLPKAVWRMGLGLNTMIDGRLPGEGRRDYALGWNVTSSLDLFPVRSLILSAKVDGGRLYKAIMVRAKATVGVAVWRFELYGGYEHTQVGRVGMGGPTVGLRLWL